MKNLILPLLLLLTNVSYSQRVVKAKQLTDHSIHIIGDNFEGTIFSTKYKTGWSHDSRDTSKQIQFSPSKREIVHAEKTLQNKLYLRYSKKPSAWKINLKTSFRQYFGFINKDGNKLIDIIGLPIHDEYFDTLKVLNNGVRILKWYNDKIDVMDGGHAFWSIVIDLKTNKIISYTVNDGT